MKPQALLCITAGFFMPLALVSTGHGAPFMLTNGESGGSVNVGVDGFGAFGSSNGPDTTDALYNPVGSIEPAGTTFQSMLGIRTGDSGARDFLTSEEVGTNPGVSGTETSAASTFSYDGLNFDLNQTLRDSTQDGERTGSILNQRYSITNTESSPVQFELVRYMDGDLAFDGSIADGGGRIELSGSEVLFETDGATGSAASTTFVGITGTGGTQPAGNRFEISAFSGLRSVVASGEALGDFVTNDTDGDQFIDQAFDVTMALRNEFSLAPGESSTYTAQTLFGNAVPPVPGSSESLPLLPEDDEAPFAFEVDQAGGETIWFDPPVAVGYEFDVQSGPLFETVTLPTNVQSEDFMIEVMLDTGFESQGSFAPGATFDFTQLDAAGVDLFRILGIDPELGLDPDDPTAFPAGLSFTSAGTTDFTMAAITEEVGDGTVPSPATLPLVLSGLAGLLACRQAWRHRRCSRALQFP